MTNKWRTINSSVHKIRLHGRRVKGTAESFSREKLREAPQKEGGEILFGPLLCDPGWYVHIPDVQNKWDGNTTHTHIVCCVPWCTVVHQSVLVYYYYCCFDLISGTSIAVCPY